jgi:hypothetical protein
MAVRAVRTFPRSGGSNQPSGDAIAPEAANFIPAVSQFYLGADKDRERRTLVGRPCI